MKHQLRIIPLAVALALPQLAMAADDSKVTTLPEVTVSASKEAAVGATQVDKASMDRMKAATSDSASLLRDVPGVSLYGAGGVSSLPVIHGLADDRLRIKVDGMDLISACGNHMNPPLSYIDPSNVESIQVFSGIAPVSVSGDSIGGAILVKSADPQFAAAGQGTLLKGEAGAFYRSNGNATGGNLSATIANEKLSMTYSGSTVESDNYTAGGNFKPAGPAFVNDGKSTKHRPNGWQETRSGPPCTNRPTSRSNLRCAMRTIWLNSSWACRTFPTRDSRTSAWT